MIPANHVQESAMYWQSVGIGVIPVMYREKRPLVATWREFQDRLPTLDEIRRWFETRFRNLAVITGWRGLVVLDFDAMPTYELWRVWADVAAPTAAASYSVRTSRGVHVYLYIDEHVPTLKLAGIDIKAAGGYVLAPPSIHPSGRAYTPIAPDAPIASVATLASVMPAELLATQPQPVVRPPSPVRGELPADPWAAAASPTVQSDNRIADIRDRYSLLDLFPGAERRGSRLFTCCPLHNDHNASLTIDLDGRRARCWAGCTPPAGYDYIDMYAALNRITVAQAIQTLGR